MGEVLGTLMARGPSGEAAAPATSARTSRPLRSGRRSALQIHDRPAAGLLIQSGSAKPKPLGFGFGSLQCPGVGGTDPSFLSRQAPRPNGPGAHTPAGEATGRLLVVQPATAWRDSKLGGCLPQPRKPYACGAAGRRPAPAARCLAGPCLDQYSGRRSEKRSFATSGSAAVFGVALLACPPWRECGSKQGVSGRLKNCGKPRKRCPVALVLPNRRRRQLRYCWRPSGRAMARAPVSSRQERRRGMSAHARGSLSAASSSTFPLGSGGCCPFPATQPASRAARQGAHSEMGVGRLSTQTVSKQSSRP